MPWGHIARTAGGHSPAVRRCASPVWGVPLLLWCMLTLSVAAAERRTSRRRQASCGRRYRCCVATAAAAAALALTGGPGSAGWRAAAATADDANDSSTPATNSAALALGATATASNTGFWVRRACASPAIRRAHPRERALDAPTQAGLAAVPEFALDEDEETFWSSTGGTVRNPPHCRAARATRRMLSVAHAPRRWRLAGRPVSSALYPTFGLPAEQRRRRNMF